MPDYNLTNTAADIDKALQDSVDLVSPLAASTNSTTAYGDDGNGVSAAEAAVAIKGAKDGNIGIDLGDSAENNLDLDLITETGWRYVTNPVNAATSASGIVNTLYSTVSTDRTAQFFFPLSGDLGNLYFRSRSAGVVTAWQELYHTGNTGVTSYTDVAPTSVESIRFGNTQGRINISKTSDGVVAAFYNGGTVAGSIEMTGLVTGYFTSSDPRLKDFLPAPTDEEINDYFNRVLDSAAVFTWKSDPKKAKVWGFNAHKASDNGLHMASEGRGPRDMAIGEEYQSAVLDEEGNELEPAKYVTSAGVDQSKDIAALVFKIAQLEQRIKTLEGV
jgi:hypothetical protein